MKKIVHLFILSCKKATELIDKKSLVHLSLKEKLQLHLHKSICDACTAYEKQSKEIDLLLHKHIHDHNTDHKTILKNDLLKEQIIKKLPNK